MDDYRPFATLSRDMEIAETQAAVSWLCVLCASSEAGGLKIFFNRIQLDQAPAAITNRLILSGL